MKRTKGWMAVCAVALGVLVVLAGCDSRNGTTQKTETRPKTPEEQRKERIERGFSVWDGSHRALTKLIKQAMNDPDSYAHVETVYWDMKDHLIVKTTFRGKNVFGGVVKNWVNAKCDLDGNVIEVLEQGP